MNKVLVAIGVILVISVGVVVLFLSAKSSPNIKNEDIVENVETAEPTTTPFPNSEEPTVNIVRNALVTTPLEITGTVPSGWMFEGSMQVKLLDDKKEVIKQTQGKEMTPGAWQSGYPVDFRATLEYETVAKTGYLVIASDNPSGLPDNDKSYEVPVKF